MPTTLNVGQGRAVAVGPVLPPTAAVVHQNVDDPASGLVGTQVCHYHLQLHGRRGVESEYTDYPAVQIIRYAVKGVRVWP